MNFKRIVSLLVAMTTILSLVGFCTFAAEPAVETVNGERTAFVSSFGKMAYGGKSRVCYKTFDEAFSALGKEGGTIVVNGRFRFSEFSDIDGRAPVKIIGGAATASSNLLDFSLLTEVELKGDLTVENASIRLAKDAYIFTNGHKFETGKNFDTYLEEKFVSPSVTSKEYVDPPSVAPGNSDGNSKIYISSGTFKDISAGAYNGKTVNGNSLVSVLGGSIEKLVAGNIGDGKTGGSTRLSVSGGYVKNLVAGSSAGTFDGNIVTEISGGDISSIVLGAENDAVINGNVVINASGKASGLITSAPGKVTGKKIVIISDSAVTVAKGAADYVITVNGGFCKPVFNGTVLSGFSVTDKFGLAAESITANGSAMTATGGIYTFKEGETEISIPASDTPVSLNKSAKYVAGYDDGTFRPQNNMTKAEAVTLLTRTITDEAKIKRITSELIGVEAGQWYVPYIGFFEKLGFLELLLTDSKTAFAPTENITRAEFTQLIYEIARFAGKTSNSELFVIKDVDCENEFYPAVSYAMSSGIVTGYEDGTFRPENNITRAEVVTMVNRFLGRTPTDSGSSSFGDVEGHWAKGQVVAACGAEGTDWTAKAEEKYVITGNNTKENVVNLYNQAGTLSADAILEGIDTVSEQVKKSVLSTPNTAELYPDRMGGTIYYFSEKNGNDANDGLSPETAFKTITAYTSKYRFPEADTVLLFERGGIYRGTLTVGKNMTIGSYGEGEKPLIMQSKKNYADESLWEKTEWDNVWKCTDLMNNVGVMGFDHDYFDHSEDTYKEKYGKLHALNRNKFTGPADLDTDLDFFCAMESGVFKTGYLYLYSEGGNPGKRFKSIEIGEKNNIISGDAQNVVIDNLALKFTGAHAIGMGTVKDRTITNCVISWVGGSVHGLSSGVPYLFGNAIEVYGGCDGFTVENNWIYQIYDTGITHQFAAGTACKQENIRYYGNLVEYCFWSIEFYNNPGTGVKASDKVKYTKNVRISHNILNNGGYGWGSISQNRGGQSYCGSSFSANEDELTEYNIFNRCSEHLLWLVPEANEVDDKNIYVQDFGKSIGRLKGSVHTCDWTAAEAIHDSLGDKNAVVIVTNIE